VLHIDFIRVDLDKTVDVEVPVVLEGEAELVARENGVVDQVLTALLITAKPADIPSQLTVDISGLEIGTNIRVGDIALPAGVTTSVDAEESVVTAQHGVSDSDLERAESEAAGETEGDEAAEGEGGDEAEAAEGGEEAASDTPAEGDAEG
jgi:large subunit ribosomal protein L25